MTETEQNRALHFAIGVVMGQLQMMESQGPLLSSKSIRLILDQLDQTYDFILKRSGLK